MTKRETPLGYVIKLATKLKDDAQNPIERANLTMAGYQLEAIDQLITQLQKSEKQSQEVEKTNLQLQKAILALSFIEIFIITLQIFKDSFYYPLLPRLFFAAGISFILMAIILTVIRRV